jgi:transposase
MSLRCPAVPGQGIQ